MNKERIVKHKIFFVDIDKEQQFIDSYREKGYKLEYINNNICKYIFTKSKDTFIPKVRIDYRTFKKTDEYEDYLTMFEDAGWKHIRGRISGRIHYFEQITPDTTEDLFSDKHSHAELYKKLFTYYISSLTFFMLMFCTLAKSFHTTINTLIVNPKSLFFTPGLWDKYDLHFVFAFLFELPFVILRNGYPFLLIASIILSAICAYKCKKKEKAYRNSL